MRMGSLLAFDHRRNAMRRKKSQRIAKVGGKIWPIGDDLSSRTRDEPGCVAIEMLVGEGFRTEIPHRLTFQTLIWNPCSGKSFGITASSQFYQSQASRSMMSAAPLGIPKPGHRRSCSGTAEWGCVPGGNKLGLKASSMSGASFSLRRSRRRLFPGACAPPLYAGPCGPRGFGCGAGWIGPIGPRQLSRAVRNVACWPGQDAPAQKWCCLARPA